MTNKQSTGSMIMTKTIDELLNENAEVKENQAPNIKGNFIMNNMVV